MSGTYQIVDISSWDVVDAEVLGRNPKVWVRQPGGHSDRQRDWLFKPVVVPRSTGHRQGEDWAEKVVGELGKLIGIPCAEVELAVRTGTPGCISRNVVPAGWNRILGSVLLETVVDGYRGTVVDPNGQERPVPGRPGHSVEKIFEALQDCEPSDGGAVGGAKAQFAGYLVLDGWVANQDRHDQNWAVLRRATALGPLRLAPSYDHASSLGFNLTDDFRVDALAGTGVERFAERGRAHRFEHDPAAPPREVSSLVSLAHRAVAAAGDSAQAPLQRLRHLERSMVEDVVASVPGLSDPTSTFIVTLLDINRRRLCGDS